MLKWLQSGVYHTTNNVQDIITDDPLATLNFKNEIERNAGKKFLPFRSGGLSGAGQAPMIKEIYSVSRTNPLYDEGFSQDHDDNFIEAQESQMSPKKKNENQVPTTSSSGYSSNQRLPLPSNLRSNMNKTNNNHHHHDGLDSDLELDSLETDLILDDDGDIDDEDDCLEEDSIQAIPAPVWPNSKEEINDLSGGVIDVDSNYVSDISLRDPQRFTNVSRNGSFVRSIQFSNNKVTPKMGSSMILRNKVPRMLEPSQLSPIGEVQDDSKIFQDSIVTDKLLQMTSFSSNNQNKSEDDPDDDQESPRKEDMDKVIAELTQAVMKSKNVTTLTRAMNKTSPDPDHHHQTTFSRGSKLRNSLKNLKASRGIEAVRDLWMQSGLKTNGRKLLVDSLSEEEEQKINHFNRRQPKRLKNRNNQIGACRIHGGPKLSSSSSGSAESSDATSPPYKQVLGFKRSVSLTSSTELYAEVYRTSSGESSRSPLYATHVRRVDHSSDPTLTTSTSSGSSSPATSSSSEANKASAKKRVQFSQEVKDNELTSPKLIYDKLPMASPPRRSQGQSVVIDITKLNEEQGFGFNKYLTTRPGSNAGDYRQQIFESPYFDYRRTHSKSGGSVYSGSDLYDSNYEVKKGLASASRNNNIPTSTFQEVKEDNSALFWKGFAIFLLVTFVLAVAVSLTLYFVYRSVWL